MNVLRKFMGAEAARLKPLLDVAYGAIVKYQRARTPGNAAALRRDLAPGDLIMLFDHCVEIMHLRLSREQDPAEAAQPWSRELLQALDQRRHRPGVKAAAGEFACSGIGASGGVASGPVRLVAGLGQLDQLRPGVPCRDRGPGVRVAMRDRLR